MKLELILALAASTLVPAFCQNDTFQGLPVKPPFDSTTHGKPSKSTGSQILWHGGPVMHGPAVYVIYYGTFPTTTEPIINRFLTDLSSQSAIDPYNVNAPYTDSTGPVGPTFRFFSPVGSQSPNTWNNSVFLDSYSQGSQLNTNSIPGILAHAFTAHTIDPNGVYLVVTAPDVKISGFCSSFCAYHTNATINAANVRYALIPDPTQKCSGCNGGIAVYGDKVTPNFDMGADTMTDDIMHELSETVTDPNLNAWYTQSGAENGDLCNYVYANAAHPIQPVTTTAGTYHKNFTLNGHDYLVQFIWQNVGAGSCAPN